MIVPYLKKLNLFVFKTMQITWSEKNDEFHLSIVKQTRMKIGQLKVKMNKIHYKVQIYKVLFE